MVKILPADELEEEIWSSLIDLSAKKPDGWTLVGAQMVALHAFEAGRARPRASMDADVIVDVRILPAATRTFSILLQETGFALEGVSTEGVGHRFVRGAVVIDLLAPDGLGERADVTTLPPARTVRVPGGSQALRRNHPVEVRLGDRSGTIPRPDLLGALLLKARAIEVHDAPDTQRSDLAFLLSLVRDPDRLREEMSKAERRWFRNRVELKERNHGAWRTLPPESAENAYSTFLLLSR